MADSSAPLEGPDLTQGVPLADVPDGGTLLGHAHGEAVLLVRRGADAFAIGAKCTHYGGPLGEGVIVGDQVRCPWHHACFDLRSGEAVGPPALKPLPCWRVEQQGGPLQGQRLFVREALIPPARPAPAAAPASVVIVGAGAAGNSAAETLRREGYAGRVTMIGAEEALPVDRPNLSKDYLAGTAPEDWLPLRDAAFYADQNIETVSGVRVMSIDAPNRRVLLSDGTSREYGALLLATGADAIRLTVPGSDKPHVHHLRSLADCRRIIAGAQTARRVVVVGASFIGLEAAAAMRTRGLEVHVVAPDARPLERVLGAELGDFVRAVHEAHGIRFHLGHTLKSIGDDDVTLDDDQVLPADLVVAGIGVRPATAVAETAGVKVDRGIVTDGFLATSVPGIHAAGDVARFPDARTGRPLRIEHWAVAQRQGQTAARNILGRQERFTAVPFFWSQHYDVPINYVGHAEGWDSIHVVGAVQARDCLVGYRKDGKITAVASIYRDKDNLNAEILLERGDHAALDTMFNLP